MNEEESLENDFDKENCPSHSYAKSIELPAEEIFKNLHNAKKFAIDIGGSLAKVAYLSEVSRIRARHYSRSGSFIGPKVSSSSDCVAIDNEAGKQPIYTVEEEQERGAKLHFIKFETKLIESCLDFIQKNILEHGSEIEDKSMKATGGGAYKYTNLLSSKLGVKVDKLDEMECLIKGCNFLLKNIPNECFTFQRGDDLKKPRYNFQNVDSRSLFPYLLVNIGSGVSILKVDSESQYERIGGTSTGGGTFWGLGSLLTDAKGFDELLQLATNGQHKNVDMLVKDIYGGDYSLLGLPGDVPASSFGKAARTSREDKKGSAYDSGDLVKSLLHMICNDIGQISSLYAQIYGLKRIFFGGYFIRGHPLTMHSISFAVNFFSKGGQKALFLRHEGYLGAVGAFVTGAMENALTLNNGLVSWGENYAGSSGLSAGNGKGEEDSLDVFDVLELDQLSNALVSCPLLLNPDKYKPDLEDLVADEKARDYWLNCFEQGIDVFVDQAVQSQSGREDARERGEKFRDQFLHRIKILRSQPYRFGGLFVRTLLDTREQFLVSFGFYDPYLQIKQEENEAAVCLFESRIKQLDQLPNAEKQVELITGLLAGNFFDWGAGEVVKCIKNGTFTFEDAKKKLQKRPWLCDDLDAWLQRCEGPPYKLAVIFVDNSGGDIVLGVFPFARELLQKGTKVILAANSYPAINDVIFSELLIVSERIAEICPVIRNALSTQQLVVMETGEGSPCIDLRRIDASLAEEMRKADLIVLEGMGRSIHTNYSARFSCDMIKLAVLKNPWLALKFGGKTFDIMFKFRLGNEFEAPTETSTQNRK
ncbi:4'-phosphopantetheine phosphatase-like [Rhopilema esculentum]|uniref:4'-phosphopantetheine phosphatase-like n=1 Tax=Rhopilema esculentum TaxID=499914 RepID=UPI0031DEBD9C